MHNLLGVSISRNLSDSFFSQETTKKVSNIFYNINPNRAPENKIKNMSIFLLGKNSEYYNDNCSNNNNSGNDPSNNNNNNSNVKSKIMVQKYKRKLTNLERISRKNKKLFAQIEASVREVKEKINENMDNSDGCYNSISNNYHSNNINDVFDSDNMNNTKIGELFATSLKCEKRRKLRVLKKIEASKEASNSFLKKEEQLKENENSRKIKIHKIILKLNNDYNASKKLKNIREYVLLCNNKNKSSIKISNIFNNANINVINFDNSKSLIKNKIIQKSESANNLMYNKNYVNNKNIKEKNNVTNSLKETISTYRDCENDSQLFRALLTKNLSTISLSSRSKTIKNPFNIEENNKSNNMIILPNILIRNNKKKFENSDIDKNINVSDRENDGRKQYFENLIKKIIRKKGNF